jgi:hypothetical protein
LTFAIIRNPFDLLVSIYFYKFPFPNGEWDKRIFDIRNYPYKSFEDFIRAFCSKGDFKVPNIQPLRRNLFFQLFHSNGDPAVKCVVRYESYKEGVSRLCNLVGIEPKNLNYKYNTSGKRRLPYGRMDDYRMYYNDELIELVNNFCKIELELFGYEFDGPINKKVVLNIKDKRYVFSQNRIL